jgi:hypothetical protein
MLCADKGRTVKNWDREAVEKKSAHEIKLYYHDRNNG